MDKKSSTREQVTVPGLDRGLAVMEFLSAYERGKTQIEIASALHLPVSSIARITLQLEATGWLRRDPDTRTFSLTMKMLTIGQRALFESNLVELSLPFMRQLRDKWLDTVVFGVMHDTEIVTIENCAGKRLFRYSIDPGHRSPVHCTAPGKAIAAFLPKAVQADLVSRLKFVRYNARTITSPKAFAKELESVRAIGYSVDRAEQYNGIYCVGAPILDRNSYPIAAIWITGPSENISKSDIPKIGADFKSASLRISSILGFST